jgi:hypothetical protein
MKVKVKRKELPRLMVAMKSLTGLKLKQALSFGKDQRMLQEEIDSFQDFEKTKKERLVELQKLFDEWAKNKELGSTVSNELIETDWEHGKEFVQLLGEYRKSESEFINEKMEITFKTCFDENDLTLKDVSSETGWMLSYFMK